MPQYFIETKQVVVRSYGYALDLPVDMGAQTVRLCDRMVKQLAESKALVDEISTLEPKTEPFSETERITAIYRDNERIWPRPRRIRGKHIEEQPDAPELPDDDDDVLTTDLF